MTKLLINGITQKVQMGRRKAGAKVLPPPAWWLWLCWRCLLGCDCYMTLSTLLTPLSPGVLPFPDRHVTTLTSPCLRHLLCSPGSVQREGTERLQTGSLESPILALHPRVRKTATETQPHATWAAPGSGSTDIHLRFCSHCIARTLRTSFFPFPAQLDSFLL